MNFSFLCFRTPVGSSVAQGIVVRALHAAETRPWVHCLGALHQAQFVTLVPR